MSLPLRKIERKHQRIGLISDTHGLLRPEALAALADSDLLIHAGDIGKPEVVAALKKIAPLVAIKGNNDTDRWAHRLPETKKITLGGHSHKPVIQTKDNVLFVNPGSAGPRRFKLPICVGKLLVQGETVDAEIIELPT